MVEGKYKLVRWHKLISPNEFHIALGEGSWEFVSFIETIDNDYAYIFKSTGKDFLFSEIKDVLCEKVDDEVKKICDGTLSPFISSWSFDSKKTPAELIRNLRKLIIEELNICGYTKDRK